LADVAASRDVIAASGTQVAFVHMASPEEADRWFARYGLRDVVRLSDPQRHLYKAFGLHEAPLRVLAHPRVWWPWFRTAFIERHGAGAAGPFWRQLTGVFVIYKGTILREMRHANSAARPDYGALVHALNVR
jgi:hypothetical protein